MSNTHWHFFVMDIVMVTSWHGNAFSVTGPVWGNLPVINGFPSKRATNTEPGYFLLCLGKLLNKQSNYSCVTIKLPTPLKIIFWFKIRDCNPFYSHWNFVVDCLIDVRLISTKLFINDQWSKTCQSLMAFGNVLIKYVLMIQAEDAPISDVSSAPS